MRSSTVQLITLATVVALVACGDASPGAASTPDATSATPVATADSPTSEAAAVAIEAKALEWHYTPDAWTVAAGEAFTLEFNNAGGVEHDWTALKLEEDIEKLAEFEESKVLLEVAEVPSHESRTETFTIEEPGTYQVICTVSGHFNTGMAGTLTVE
ncbi:cupredoxin domain-containing protein [Salsipaludibacter albus]|uniref:cupredoxin domain-containing protein n=1 Tax=Salsipaludibacter albus TaxID=2849650 RepID=UPI001EE3CE01|nr:cupredoxin domain-containing protein [Salsipaludibacter albus]MBY5163590.1 cupredoxin domain-containing protein [Salsipaludibacter albus]